MQPRYRAGGVYAWRLEVHSVLRRIPLSRAAPAGGSAGGACGGALTPGDKLPPALPAAPGCGPANGQAPSATLDNHATVVMRIVSGGALDVSGSPAPPAAPMPGPVVVTLQFRRYHTTVSGFGPFAAALRRSAAATDQAVLRMRPLEMRLTPGAPSRVLALGSPAAPRQARTMLRQLLATQALPLGAVRPGDDWRREEIQNLAQFHYSFPLSSSSRFIAWRPASGGGWLAAVRTLRHASVQLPPSAIPGFAAAAAAGYASLARLRVDGQTGSEYTPDGILTSAHSHTRTWLTIRFVGGSPRPGGGPAAVTPGAEMQVDSTGSVQRIAPPR